MTKRELRKLAESKDIGFMAANGIFFFVFPGDFKAHAATKEMIERVRALPDFEKPKVSRAPENAVSLEGLSQEERDAKALDLMGAVTIPGLDNYPVVEEQ